MYLEKGPRNAELEPEILSTKGDPGSIEIFNKTIVALSMALISGPLLGSGVMIGRDNKTQVV